MSVWPAIMSNPSYWALISYRQYGHFRLLNQHLLQCFLVQPSLKSFSLLQMFNRLNSGERKGGKERGYQRDRERDLFASFPSPSSFMRLSRRLHPLPIFSEVYSLIYTPSQFTCYLLINLATFKTVWVEPPGFSILNVHYCSSIKRFPMNIKLQASLYFIYCL